MLLGDRQPDSTDARAVLREVFGYPGFRGKQAEAIDALLAGRDVIVLLPTGAGKSLCYQVPALVASRAGRGATLVISPLIALMQDQVEALCARGVRAAAIHSHQQPAEQRDHIDALIAGELALLYVSPERAAAASFRRAVAKARIAQIAIDEAHCVSQWGHDFRPEYMQLHELRAHAPGAPVAALTATATPEVVDEIERRLELRAPALARGEFARANLRFEVLHRRGEAARVAAAIEAIEAAGLRASTGPGRGIVYCSTRKHTETMAKALKSGGVKAGYYHAGRTALARERAKRAFDLGRSRVLVATNAFGMGIDYPDVRLIVHAQAPGSLEAYYQEAGRAGRDGLPARCLLLFGLGDLVTQRRLHSGKGGAGLEARHERALGAIERYANELAQCRQVMISAHFTGSEEHAACGVCDLCDDAAGVAERRHAEAPAAEPVEPLPEPALDTIVEAVGQLPKPVGKTNLARALRGSRAKAVRALGLVALPAHGALRGHDERSIVAAIERLLEAQKLERRGRKYPTVWLPGRPVRPRKAERDPGAASRPRAAARSFGAGRGLRHTDLARELDNFRKRAARSLKWKPYMVFQRNVIQSIDRKRPRTRDDLARIPGLGPAKIERFGDEILALVRRHDG